MKSYIMSRKDGKNERKHRIIAEEVVGRPLRPNEVVHHIDGNKRNNTPNNLMVVTRSEHARIHKGQLDKSKPVIQMTKDGRDIKQWPSARAAGLALGICYSNICACCKGRQKSIGGFKCRYA